MSAPSLLLVATLLLGSARAADGPCTSLGGLETDKTSCIDSKGGRFIWYNDGDADDYADATVCCCPSSSTCDNSGGGDNPTDYENVVSRANVSSVSWEDCQDADADVNPGATETWYDGLDGDCGEDTDFDQDEDGWYSEDFSDYTTVTPGTSTVVSDGADSLGEDCEDTDDQIYPGADERSNGLDDDCDSLEDEGTDVYDDDGDCACEDDTCTGSSEAGCVVLLGGDCDDTDPDVGPDAVETWYNGYDQDCDGLSDYDQDQDGSVPDAYEGKRTTVKSTGAVVESGRLPGGDCLDTDAETGPTATDDWYDGLDVDCAEDDDYDQDGDGYVPDDYEGLATTDAEGAAIAGTGDLPGGDCDDTEPDVNPSQDEAINDVDDDCDGAVDNGTSVFDDDGDCACEARLCLFSVNSACTTVTTGDCDDDDATVSPSAAEVWYDGYDQDCDGACDYDQDGDGAVHDDYLGLETVVAATGEVVDAGALPGGDCDDTDASSGPSVGEDFYDGIDADCAGDDDYDQDRDGYVPDEYAGLGTTLSSGEAVSGTGGLPGGDCEDTDADVNPGEDETVNDTDDDCDGAVDNHTTVYDDDGDCACEALLCTSSSNTSCAEVITGDCDDDDATVSPSAAEVWYDGYDQDCDGACDYDQDGDGSVADEHVGLETVIASSGEVVDAGALPGGDCDDEDPSSGPGAEETFYDGVDADCAEDDDYDQDRDGYVPDAYEGLATTSSAGVLVTGTGALPGGDCEDTDDSYNPSATESWYDGLDQDCDGACDFDQDSDGYNVVPSLVDLDSVPDTTWPDGTVVCTSDLLPGGDCVDSGDQLADLDPMSTKDPADIHPDRDETCEVKDTVQIDDDCNGDINTQGEGDDESYITSDWGTPYYQDADGDGQGNPDIYYYLCEQVDGYTTSFGDCDDTNADVNPDAPELCNNQDEDCDGQVDEASGLGDDSGCIDLYPDQDLDGYGSTASSTCMCYDGTSDECGDGYEYNDEDEICYTRTYGDCYDYDSSIRPLEDGEPHVEYLDGDDNDCNKELPLVELDCDDDGSLPLLPTAVDPTTPVGAAGDVGLTDCRGPSLEADPDCCLRDDCEDGEVCDDLDLTEFVTCWDDYRLRLSCDEETGLVTVSQVADGVAERFDGGRRLYSEGRVCNTAGDCDDHCPARCPDADEVCDGVDNDCDNADALLDDGDQDAIPDSLDEDDLVPGYVHVSELDLDADGYLGCDVSDLVGREQQALSVAACATSEALADCDDTCTLASPAAPEERCDAFQNVCEGDIEGADADRDAYLTCGAWGPEDSDLAEDIYALVYVPAGGATPIDSGLDSGLDSASDDGEVVPLLLPRPEAPECDTTLTEALGALIGDEALQAASATGDQEPLLRLCLAAESCARIRDGQDLAWPADCSGIDGACTVARLTLSPDADDDLYEDDVVADLDADADCSSHPEQLITRSVWSGARILAARALVVQWDCFRLDGTYGCGDLSPPEGWQTPFPEGAIEGGNTSNADPGEALLDDPRWWKEIGRYDPEPMLNTLLKGCWGEPDPGSDSLGDVIDRRTGGDCADGEVGSNRGLAEGPDDLLGIYYDDRAACETCTDGLDNNCNGLMDCAEPACARCFVGQGSGCGGGDQSPCAESGCTSAPREGLKDPGALALLGVALASFASRLRRRR